MTRTTNRRAAPPRPGKRDTRPAPARPPDRAGVERALRESEDRYRQLVQALPAPVYTCDAAGRILLCNAAATKLWGREPTSSDRWCGVQQIYSVDGRRLPLAKCPMALAARQGEPIRDAEILLERPDGGRSRVLAFADPVCSASGRVTSVVTMLIDITAITETESALQASAHQLQTLSLALEHSPTSVLITSPTGEIDYVNPTFTRTTGYDAAEVLGCNPRLLKSGVHPPEFYKQMWDTISAGLGWRGEFCNRKKNGDLFWEYTVIVPARDSRGRLRHFVSIAEDITERKRAGLAIAENRQRLAGVIESAMDAIISVDESQRIVLFNAAAERMFGCPAADAIGRRLERFIPERFRKAHEQHVHHFGETGVTSRKMGSLGAVMGLRSDGSEFPIEAAISQVCVEGKNLYTVILRDVTSRIRADAVLRQQTELLHLTHDAIFVWREGQGIEFWNASATKIYGFGPASVRGRDLSTILQTRYPCAWEEVETALREEGFWEGEVRQTTKSGAELTVASRLQLVSGAGEKMTVLVTNRDITERRRLQEELIGAIEAEQRRIGRDLHDGLGQELTAIGMLGSVVQNSLLAKGYAEAETLAKLGKMLKHASSEVRRISHGLQPVASEPSALMTGLRQLVAESAALHAIEAAFECPSPVRIHDPGVANHLYRIAQEAVQNAVRHARAQKIAVRLKMRGDRVTMEIVDDGQGISKKRKTMPCGIGLSTMRYRANAAGGFLQILRPAGGGTLVRCSVPLAQDLPKNAKCGRSKKAL